MSLMNIDDILNLQLVRLPAGGTPAGAEPTAHNLTLGEFLEPDPDGHLDRLAAHLLSRRGDTSYKLKPQEMVWAVSREVIELPEDVTGYLHMKTGLASRGIMSITTGMIDPSWRGPVSVLLVNFSENDVHLDAGEQFLRVTFHKHVKPTTGRKYPLQTSSLADRHAEYTAKQRKEVRVLPSTFLNLKGHRDDIVSTVTGAALIWAALAAVVFALTTMFIPIGVDLIRQATPWEWVNPVAADVARLEQRIRDLEARHDAQSTETTPATTPPATPTTEDNAK